jgi:hypothetical protein
MNYIKIQFFFCSFIVFIAISSCSPKFSITQFTPKLPTSVYGINEPAIVVNPINQNEISVGAVYRHFFLTKNGGKTWIEDTLYSTFGVRGDPALVYNSTGRLFYFHLANLSSKNSLDRIVCQEKERFTSTFENGTFTQVDGKQHDKEAVYFDPKTNIFHLTWTQFDKYASDDSKDSSHILYASSRDDCATWSIPKRLDTNAGKCLDDDNTLEGAISITDTAGNLHVFWMGPTAILQNSFSKLDQNWTGERTIKNLKNGWVIEIPGVQRSNGFAQVVCDKSGGKFRGRIYYCWVDDHAQEKQHDVWLMHSDDGTKSWSAPLKIGKDKFGTDQFFSAIALDPSNGNLYILYNDLSNYSQTENWQLFDVKMSSSKDGGQSFTEETVRSKRTVNKDLFFGDYNSISVVNGTIAAAYTTVIQDKCTIEVAIKKVKP